MDYSNVSFSILKINKGAKDADEHYLQTGHYIKLFYEQIENFKGGIFDLKKQYKCQECDFCSYGGERIKKI